MLQPLACMMKSRRCVSRDLLDSPPLSTSHLEAHITHGDDIVEPYIIHIRDDCCIGSRFLMPMPYFYHLLNFSMKTIYEYDFSQGFEIVS